eukprot:6618113-Lingulodinium_polyedra.AAC.1
MRADCAEPPPECTQVGPGPPHTQNRPSQFPRLTDGDRISKGMRARTCTRTHAHAGRRLRPPLGGA